MLSNKEVQEIVSDAAKCLAEIDTAHRYQQYSRMQYLTREVNFLMRVMDDEINQEKESE